MLLWRSEADWPHPTKASCDWSVGLPIAAVIRLWFVSSFLLLFWVHHKFKMHLSVHPPFRNIVAVQVSTIIWLEKNKVEACEILGAYLAVCSTLLCSHSVSSLEFCCKRCGSHSQWRGQILTRPLGPRLEIPGKLSGWNDISHSRL